ncbi:MAG: ribosomal-protein-alanine N-acetyltransferase [Candidatus Izimaplasma bacterium HR2]|nr:MAG: ribosomal-protein-alanine N-acetyltransferase [Candidatus Izimaplasma bacterium HR2]
MELLIRKMDMSDVPFVYEEEIKIFGKSLGEMTLYNEILHNKMSRYFIALVDKKRAAYVGSWLTIPNAEILNLFVLEEYRGQGIGKKLIDEVVKVCNKEKIDMLTLEVRVSNKYAIKMYEDIGFKVGIVRKKYYENKEDALLMILSLGGK